MTQGQRTVTLTLVTELVLITWYGTRFLNRNGTGAFDGAEGLMALGRMTLWTIGVMVVFIILAHILAYIAAAIANRGELPEDVDLTDERDAAIEARGEKVAHILGGIAMVVALFMLARGADVPAVIATIFLGHLTGDVIGNVVKLATYGRG